MPRDCVSDCLARIALDAELRNPSDGNRRRSDRARRGISRARRAGQNPSPALAIPWQERPAGVRDVVWRHSRQPGHRPPSAARRAWASTTARSCRSATASPPCFAWRIARASRGCTWAGATTACSGTSSRRRSSSPTAPTTAWASADYAYDPRVVKIEDKYYITWCGGHNGPTISIASTTDFQKFTRLDNAFLPHNRNGVLFPRQDRRQVLHAEPAQRQRPHAVRRHLHQPKPRHDSLGHAPQGDGPRRRRARHLVAADQDRRRARFPSRPTTAG